MLELARLLALAAFVALAIALFLFLRRAGRLLAETRSRQSFRRATTDLVGRACTSLDGVAARIDAVRRQTLAAQIITENVTAASDAVRRYTEEAEALSGAGESAATRDVRDGIIAELNRAGRALEMVDHGVTILVTARRATGRELEAQTSIKRGYLGLLHARGALAKYGARADELARVEHPRLFERTLIRDAKPRPTPVGVGAHANERAEPPERA